MHELINQKISVISKYDQNNGSFLPVKLLWQGRVRYITSLGLHYTKHQGRKLLHIFTVTDNHLAYSLNFDTENLNWTLLEISDGNT